MAQAVAPSPVVNLEERLVRGAAFLFDLEQKGDMGAEYERWLQHWIELLREYEQAQAA